MENMEDVFRAFSDLENLQPSYHHWYCMHGTVNLYTTTCSTVHIYSYQGGSDVIIHSIYDVNYISESNGYVEVSQKLYIEQ
jgi:hypothetical protein